MVYFLRTQNGSGPMTVNERERLSMLLPDDTKGLA